VVHIPTQQQSVVVVAAAQAALVMLLQLLEPQTQVVAAEHQVEIQQAQVLGKTAAAVLLLFDTH
jgi:hypothetical protein